MEAAQVLDAGAVPASIDGWRVDVLVPSVRLVIEYDGAYWHDGKQALDARKTRDLVAAGYLVVRVRENELKHLEGFSLESRVRQVSFRPDFGRVEDVVTDCVRWATTQGGVQAAAKVPVAAAQSPGKAVAGTRSAATDEDGSKRSEGRAAGGQPPVSGRPAPAKLWRPPRATTQTCSADDCSETAVFKTYTKPTWCLEHVDAIYRAGGLERIEPVGHPQSFVLTRCATCGCEAHYRFEYVLELNARDEPVCRACFWAAWATQFVPQVGPGNSSEALVEAARAEADASGMEYVGPCLELASHRIRCRRCGKISARRLGDMGGGCSTCS